MTPLETLKQLADTARKAENEYRRTWGEMTDIFRGAYYRRRCHWGNYFELFNLPRHTIAEHFSTMGLSTHNDRILIRIEGVNGLFRVIQLPVELFYAQTPDLAKNQVSEYMDCLAQWATNDKLEAEKIRKRQLFKQLQTEVRDGKL